MGADGDWYGAETYSVPPSPTATEEPAMEWIGHAGGAHAVLDGTVYSRWAGTMEPFDPAMEIHLPIPAAIQSGTIGTASVSGLWQADGTIERWASAVIVQDGQVRLHPSVPIPPLDWAVVGVTLEYQAAP